VEFQEGFVRPNPLTLVKGLGSQTLPLVGDNAILNILPVGGIRVPFYSIVICFIAD